MSTQLPNKREMLQLILDGEELGWWIKKPQPTNPRSTEELCILQHPATGREIEISLDNSLFQDAGRQAELERRVHDAIKNAK